ncbi:unnamed protein product [Caenorhabditis sp. 36 PRJEB53466]|nr:unnamed protein product [Caenorhabditis sp. 36 PRJEB53466]
MQIANLGFFIFDNLVFRIPSTGLLTSFCASISLNHFLKVLYMLQLFSNYSSIFYSLLFCLTRLVIVFHPNNHHKICVRLFFFFIPSTFMFSLCADFFMLPALGYCRQYPSPYPFGAIYISFGLTWFEIRTDICMLYLSFIAPLLIMLMNTALIYKAVGLLSAELGTYALIIRNPLVDLGMILVPWIFYLSHPMFHEKSALASTTI